MSACRCVVTGGVIGLPSRTGVEIVLDNLACRLREHAPVDGFAGSRRDLPPANSGGVLVRGLVASTRVTAGERLVVTIGDAIPRGGSAGLGQWLTLRPRSVNPRQQRSGRHELHRRYATRRSWLSRGPPPSPRRRDVPPEVVVARQSSPRVVAPDPHRTGC